MKRVAPQSILVVNIRLIGDVVLTTPLIRLLKEAYPGACIDVLVNRGTGEFLEKDPQIRKVLYAGRDKGTGNGKVKRYWRTIFRSYDLAINMNSADRGSIAVLLAGRKWRMGFYTGERFWSDSWKRLLFSHPIRYPYPIHTARLCEVVMRQLGHAPNRLEARIHWDKADEEKVGETLRLKGLEGPYFVVHPYARWRYKYWRFDHFARASDAIARKYQWRPVWTCSPSSEEQKGLAEAASLCQVAPVLVPGEFTLNQMTCLLSRASFYLGLDTAVSHLAASTGIPMVVLYGPTITDWWSPWNNKGAVEQQCPLPRGKQRAGNIIVVQKDMPCIPCGRAGCNNNGLESPCMQEITTEEVLKCVDELMGAGRVEA